MPRFGKIHAAIYMIIHRKKFKKVSIDILKASQKFEKALLFDYKNLETNFKKLEKNLDAAHDLSATLVDENRELKKKIEKLKELEEYNNNRFDMLDL